MQSAVIQLSDSGSTCLDITEDVRGCDRDKGSDSVPFLQLERKSQARIDEKWRALDKKAKREAKKMGDTYVPPEQRPEAAFVASLIDEFIKVQRLSARLVYSAAGHRSLKTDSRQDLTDTSAYAIQLLTDPASD